jgi:hypothetical protein
LEDRNLPVLDKISLYFHIKALKNQNIFTIINQSLLPIILCAFNNYFQKQPKVSSLNQNLLKKEKNGDPKERPKRKKMKMLSLFMEGTGKVKLQFTPASTGLSRHLS